MKVNTGKQTRNLAEATAAAARQKAVFSQLRQRYTPEAINKLHRLHWDLIKVLSDKAAAMDSDEAFFIVQQGIQSLLELDAVMAEL